MANAKAPSTVEVKCDLKKETNYKGEDTLCVCECYDEYHRANEIKCKGKTKIDREIKSHKIKVRTKQGTAKETAKAKHKTQKRCRNHVRREQKKRINKFVIKMNLRRKETKRNKPFAENHKKNSIHF